MGTWFDSLAVKGAVHDEVRERLAAWAELRGLQRDARPLFACDDREMGFHLVSNDDWTVVLPSRHEETAQLVRRLAPLGKPMLRLWCASSDAWGHVLLEDGVPTVEFADQGPYDRDADLSEEPPTDPSLGDPERVCRVLGVEGRAREITSVQGWRPTFRERAARKFCGILGITPAASRHSYMEDGELPGAGWRVEHLVFAPDDGEATFDLHDATAWPSRPPEERREIDPELAAFVQARARQTKILMMPLMIFFRAAGFVARLLPSRWLMRRAAAHDSEEAGADDGFESALRPSCRRDGDWLVNETHGVRVKAPNDAVILPSMGNGTVIGARTGEVRLSIQAVRFEELRQWWTHSEIIEDESLVISGRKARRRVVRTPERRGGKKSQPSCDVLLVVIQAPRAVYSISCDAADMETQRRIVMDAAESFQVEP